MQLDHLGRRLGALALLLVGLLSFLKLLRGTDLAHIVLDAIALAVAAMPEGLPVVVTVTLALGMRTMARQRAIVKRLASVETLGCTTVICSDKTGTLTLNQMTVRTFFYQGKWYEVSGQGYRPQGVIRARCDGAPLSELTPLLIPLVACNDSCVDDGRVIGDPMEAALLILADKGGIARHQVAAQLPRLAEVPFDAAHKFMATFHREDDRVHVFVKGAPDVLLARCDRWRVEDEDQPLDVDSRERIDAAYIALAAGGLRGLLIASRTIPARAFDASGDLLAWVNGLTCIGLVGLLDPPRPEAQEAIVQCKHAGIAVKMITGDHQSTGAAIASALGLEGQTISGGALDRMDAEELATVIDDIAVFARVTPGTQGEDRARAASRGARGRDDGRRRQRRACAEECRHRRRDGYHRHGGRQGSRHHGADRR